MCIKLLLKKAFAAGRAYQYGINPYNGKAKNNQAPNFTQWCKGIEGKAPCPCHDQKVPILHFRPCCENGYIDLDKAKIVDSTPQKETHRPFVDPLTYCWLP